MHGCFTNGETARRGDLLRGVNYVGHLWLLCGLKKELPYAIQETHASDGHHTLSA
jgi:hypothetical protein